MNKTLNKILIGLIALILLPVALFTVYEYTRINDNEKLINTVYQNQLETIVSSVNFYVQDVVENWASRIDIWKKDKTDSSLIRRMTNENLAITGIYLTHNNRLESLYETFDQKKLTHSIASIHKSESKTISQLKSYYENNYRKFVSQPVDSNTVVIFFMCSDQLNDPTICFIGINMKRFLHNYIQPRIQSIAQNNFIITIKEKKNGFLLLSTEKEIDQNLHIDQEGELWLFPNLQMGISLKDQTINELATIKAREGIIMVVVVFIVLIVGIWFLYSSVKREIHLTQIKSEFISNVSHEIRTPLALISVYIETLEMGRIISSEKINEYYGIISKETARLTGMVNKILSFSKMEKGKQNYNFKGCDLNTITQNVLETYQFHFKNKGFTYNLNQSNHLYVISCDSEAIANAIINLIDNAIKYSREIKNIDIKTGTEKNMAYVEVKDYGPGIPKKHQKLVFDKFYRVTSGNLANEIKGTGLGLAIVSEIVKAHKGKITLNSKTGEGCTFRLYFPIISAN